MGMGGGLIFAWWVWAMVAIVCVLLAICAVLKLHEANIYLLREVSKVIRRPWFETVLLLFLIGGLVQYGATKGTNGTSGVSGNLLPSGPMGTAFLLQAGEATNDSPMTATFHIDAFDVDSSNIALSVAWPMDFFSEPATIDLFGSATLTNRFEWIEAVRLPDPFSNSRIPYYENVVVGDSGNPCFLLFGTNAVFLGAAHTGNRSVAADTYEGSCSPFVTYYAEQIQDAMDELCPGYSLHYLNLNGFECLGQE